jgi:hypothetical protein
MRIKAMSYTRQDFISKVRDRYLLGAYGEFMCRQIAKAVNKPDSWTDEVHDLIKQIHSMMDPETKVTVRRRGDLLTEALREAMREAPGYIVSSKNKVAKYYPELMPNIKKLKFNAYEEFVKMIDEFLPEYRNLLPAV